MLGTSIEAGDILIGKLMSQATNESSYSLEDRSLRAKLGIQISTANETSNGGG